MNRTDRLLAIILELQRRKVRRAEDLAAAFEVTKRSIYRDIQALCEAGVPVVAVPGQGYSIMEGYFLPPLSFTQDEAMMLILGSEFVAQKFDAQYRDAARLARSKIEAVLSKKLKVEVTSLKESIHFVSFGPGEDEKLIETLKMVRRAVIERKTIAFRYYKRWAESLNQPPTTREADPYALIHIGGHWLMAGYCHLREELRSFRLSRMENLEITQQTFERMKGFKLSHLARENGMTTTVKVLVSNNIARWVEESKPYFTEKAEQRKDGLLLTIRTSSEEQLLQWILSWGSNVKVLEPERIRQKVRDEAVKVLQQSS